MAKISRTFHGFATLRVTAEHFVLIYTRHLLIKAEILAINIEVVLMTDFRLHLRSALL